MAKVTNRSHYAGVFDQWGKSPVKLGAQPNEAQLTIVHAFKRAGGKEALGMAMALRDGGMTDAQMRGASSLFDGNPTACRNTIKNFVLAGMFDRDDSTKGLIKISLTPRGQQYVDRKAAGQAEAEPKAKAVKAKAKARKPRKAPAKPVEAPAIGTDGQGTEAQQNA